LAKFRLEKPKILDLYALLKTNFIIIKQNSDKKTVNFQQSFLEYQQVGLRSFCILIFPLHAPHIFSLLIENKRSLFHRCYRVQKYPKTLAII